MTASTRCSALSSLSDDDAWPKDCVGQSGQSIKLGIWNSSSSSMSARFHRSSTVRLARSDVATSCSSVMSSLRSCPIVPWFARARRRPDRIRERWPYWAKTKGKVDCADAVYSTHCAIRRPPRSSSR